MYRYLKQRGIQPWLDAEDLLPGQNWEVEIPNAIDEADVILVCLSKNSVNKEGYIQKEITFALDKALEKPEGTIFVIPVKLEECDVPKRLNLYQWVDYFRTDERKRLLKGLDLRSTNLGDEVAPVMVENTRRRSFEDKNRQITEEAIAREKAEHDQREKESAEKLVREKLEREKTEKDVADKLARDKAEREQVEKDATEEFAREKAKKLAYEKARQADLWKEHQQERIENIQKFFSKNGKRLSIIGGGIVLIFLFAYMISGIDFPLRPEIIKVSSTPPTPTPEFDIGSTMVSEIDGMTLIYVPAGEFTMGSDMGSSAEQPVNIVYLNSYWIDKTEVTTSMYAECIVDGECSLPSVNTRYFDPAYPKHPMVYISWNQANEYCVWAGRKLPNEAQWEKAARNTDSRLFPWGNNMPSINLLNFNLNNNDTTEIGSYPQGASLYGVLDMSGNVSEWVSSLYLPYPYNEGDGREALSDGFRVLRGGSWKADSSEVRSTYREKADPTTSSDEVGFRCMLDVTP